MLPPARMLVVLIRGRSSVSVDRRQAERLAGLIAEALEAADLDAYAELLHPDVRWGAPGDPSPPCQNRAQVLAWYRSGREAGTRAHVTETVVAGDRILVGLRVFGNDADPGMDGEVDRWQLLTVRDGKVADIRGFDDRDEANAAAGLGPAPAGAGPAPS
jgi:ketosteroid isomerase-like protein